MPAVAPYNESIFENIKHISEYGEEFWYARELQNVLEYKEWRNFAKVLERAKIACEESKNTASDHFVNINKMVDIGSDAQQWYTICCITPPHRSNETQYKKAIL